MTEHLGGSAHKDRSTRLTLAAWPRLLSLHLAAEYCSVGSRTIEDWIREGLLTPVPMPGSILKDKEGNIIAHAKDRRICKILLAREDVDGLIDRMKGVA